MPNLIKKVLANVAQVLTATEKQQARDNIGIPKYAKLANYDTTITDVDQAGTITRVGAFDILYYHDNSGNLRLAVRNMDVGDTHSIAVSSNSMIEQYADLDFTVTQALSVMVNNSVGQHQDLRIVIDGAYCGELSIQLIPNTGAPALSRLWYKV